MSLSPSLLNRLISNRGLTQDTLFLKKEQIPSPFELKDMDKAADIIASTLDSAGFILVIADYDCDGATSCATLIRGLVMLGAEPDNIAFIVPDRAKHGYGLTPVLVEEIKRAGWRPDLIITVDNGISSHEGISAIQTEFPGAKTVVTDHHLQADTLPNADAIVNPNRNDCTFPSKAIAGVGVAFYVLMGVKDKMNSKAPINNLLNIVAMGTICDVVPMDALNRTFVKYGINQIRSGDCIQGISSLVAIKGKTNKDFVSSDFGFGIGPLVNACGRMTDMSVGIGLLLEDDKDQADELAAILLKTNQERQDVESEMKSQAKSLLKDVTSDSRPDILCIYDERWHQGVIGLLASRIKEDMYRPAVVFAKAENGDIKASCRSVPGIHIRDVLAAVFEQDDILGRRFGGHSQAAGLSIKEEHFNLFKTRLEAEMKKIPRSFFTPTFRDDGQLQKGDFTVNNAKGLAFDLPWGQNFEAPQFKGDFKVFDARVVGKNKDCLQFKTMIGNEKLSGIAFKTGMPKHFSEGKGSLECLYVPGINEWRGNTSVQIVVSNILN